MTPAGTSNELDVQNGWEENTKHTLTNAMYRSSTSNTSFCGANRTSSVHVMCKFGLHSRRLVVQRKYCALISLGVGGEGKRGRGGGVRSCPTPASSLTRNTKFKRTWLPLYSADQTCPMAVRPPITPHFSPLLLLTLPTCGHSGGLGGRLRQTALCRISLGFNCSRLRSSRLVRSSCELASLNYRLISVVN